MRGTKVFVFRGSQDLREGYMDTELVNAALNGKPIEYDDITITEVFADVILNVQVHLDWKVPDAALKEIGFEPYNKEGH